MDLKIFDIKDTCTGCGACVSACNLKALTLSYDDEGFYFPHLNESKCVNCRLCEKVCHVINSPSYSEVSKNYNAYMLKALDKDLVMNSSSGGAFSLLSDVILSRGGVIYGASYNYEKECLEHTSTEHVSLDALRKSKYVESYSGDVFRSVYQNLRDSKYVLFCGTPCQINGLNTYLASKNIQTDKLITVRFICHGVPSNKFFTEYKHFEERRFGSKITHIDFRNKSNGWKNICYSLEFENGKRKVGNFYESYYYNLFFQDILLRKSCYSCEYVLQETSDLTIADFWGINAYMPDNNEIEGVSLIMTHNKKAEELLLEIADKCSTELIPHEYLDYIYRDVDNKSKGLETRQSLMPAIIKNGYMHEAHRMLKSKIIRYKIRKFILSVYHPLVKCFKKTSK